MCLLLEASLVQSRGQIQYILGVTDWYHKRWWSSTSITHFTLSWFQHGDISSKSHEIHLRVLKKVKTDLFPAVVSIVSMILPGENRNIADQISSYLLFLLIHSQKNNWKKFLQKVMLVASNSGWGELFDGRWLCFWVVFRAGCKAATVRFFAAAALVSLLEAASSVYECFQGPECTWCLGVSAELS